MRCIDHIVRMCGAFEATLRVLDSDKSRHKPESFKPFICVQQFDEFNEP